MYSTGASSAAHMDKIIDSTVVKRCLLCTVLLEILAFNNLFGSLYILYSETTIFFGLDQDDLKIVFVFLAFSQ